MAYRFKLLSLYLFKYIGLLLIARLITRRKIRILCYHGGSIDDEYKFNPKLFCQEGFFKSRIDWLQKNGFSVITLDDAVNAALNDNVSSSLPTVLTFDDGWHSTISELLPHLSAKGFPSTLYLCTRHIIEQWPVPNVTVRYILWKSGRERFDLAGLGKEVDGYYALNTKEHFEASASKLSLWITDNCKKREQVLNALTLISNCLGLYLQNVEQDFRRFEYLSLGDIKELHKYGCTPELHGHDHHYYIGDTYATQADISLCKEHLSRASEYASKHYCYPSGAHDENACHILQSLGVISGSTCIPGLVPTGQPNGIYYLPRFLDGHDVRQIEFEAEMSGFMEFIRKLFRS